MPVHYGGDCDDCCRGAALTFLGCHQKCGGGGCPCVEANLRGGGAGHPVSTGRPDRAWCGNYRHRSMRQNGNYNEVEVDKLMTWPSILC